MADINNLKEKLEKAEAKVEKCRATIVRHEKQLDKKIKAVIKGIGIDLTGKTKEEIDEMRDPYRGTDHSWVMYDVVNKLEDIRGAKKKLEEAKRIAFNWVDKLNKELEKERKINEDAPQVIKDFLEQWKQLAYEWHIKRYNSYQDFKKKLDKEEKEEIIKFAEENPEDFGRYLDDNGKVKEYWVKDTINIRGKGLEKHLKEKELDYRSIQSRRAFFAGQAVMHMDTIRNEAKRLEWLEKTLESEKKAKLFDLINRITDITGVITDATGLKVGNSGDLNGVIVGERASAKVETISAGGYAVQCFHYRTLVHKL